MYTSVHGVLYSYKNNKNNTYESTNQTINSEDPWVHFLILLPYLFPQWI